MSSQDRKKETGPSRQLTPAEKERVDSIIREAEAVKPAHDPDVVADLQKQVKESEGKRLVLAEALHSSREQMRRLFPGLDREQERAQPFGVFVRYGRDRQTAIIKHHGRLYEARIQPTEPTEARPTVRTFHAIRESRSDTCDPPDEFRKGELLLLDNELRVLESRGFDLISGSLGTVQQVLGEEKLLVKTVGDENLVVIRAEPLMGKKVLAGDPIEYEPDSLFAYNLLPKGEVDRLVLEKVPNICYEHIGGLSQAIEQIRDAIELPHLYPEIFREHHLVPPKGILLYGPPGCGKTLIAKAVANSLARRIQEMTGERGESYFLNVKGPELLNKFVGETEQAIRDLFARARSQATYRTPVTIFFDEMDSLFRVRGSGVSSDMEATIVPQFLAELDGLEALENVVIIGATNREDLIDPAVLRPGRLDRKIRIPRPGQGAATEIFAKYLTPDLPLVPAELTALGGPAEAVAAMIQRTVAEMYGGKPENELIEVTYANGANKVLYLRDFASGAIIENIVSRAKFLAVKDFIDKGKKGIGLEHLLTALRQEYQENEDLPGNTNPAEWYRIIGKGGEKVIRVRSLFGQSAQKANAPAKPEEVVDPGAALS